MADDEVKEILDEYEVMYGAFIEMLTEAVNEMGHSSDSDCLMLTPQHLLTIAGIISENLVKAGDSQAAKVENS